VEALRGNTSIYAHTNQDQVFHDTVFLCVYIVHKDFSNIAKRRATGFLPLAACHFARLFLHVADNH